MFGLYIFHIYFICFIDRTAEDMIVNRMREGEEHVAKGVQAGTRTWGRHSEDKASVHGMSALPTELNGAPKCLFLTLTG